MPTGRAEYDLSDERVIEVLADLPRFYDAAMDSLADAKDPDEN